MSDWPAQDPGTLRRDAIGDVAGAFRPDEIEGTIGPLARLILEGRLPKFALGFPVSFKIRQGRREKRRDLVLREVGLIVDALIMFLAADAREDDATRARVVATVRALSLPAIDALEDLLAYSEAPRPLLEAERMARAGLLAGEWALVVEGAEGARRLAVRMPSLKHVASA